MGTKLKSEHSIAGNYLLRRKKYKNRVFGHTSVRFEQVICFLRILALLQKLCKLYLIRWQRVKFELTCKSYHCLVFRGWILKNSIVNKRIFKVLFLVSDWKLNDSSREISCCYKLPLFWYLHNIVNTPRSEPGLTSRIKLLKVNLKHRKVSHYFWKKKDSNTVITHRQIQEHATCTKCLSANEYALSSGTYKLNNACELYVRIKFRHLKVAQRYRWLDMLL